MTVNEMVFKLAEHKQASKDLKEKSDLLQEQVLLNLGCIKVKDDKKVEDKSKTIQQLDREKLEQKFSKENKETLN